MMPQVDSGNYLAKKGSYLGTDAQPLELAQPSRGALDDPAGFAYFAARSADGRPKDIHTAPKQARRGVTRSRGEDVCEGRHRVAIRPNPEIPATTGPNSPSPLYGTAHTDGVRCIPARAQEIPVLLRGIDLEFPSHVVAA